MSRPKLLRYSLRSVAVVVTLLAVILAIQSYRVRQQNHVVREVRALDGDVWNVDLDRDGMIIGNRLAWLPKSFDAVVPRTYNYIYLTGEEIGDDELELAVNFPNLEGLNISASEITDAGLRRLFRCTRLRKLQLYDISTISESAIKEFRSKIPNCEILR